MRAQPWHVAAALTLSASSLVTPAIAHAATIYPPAGACTTSPAAVGPGETIQFACEAATFSSNETVTITVTGENGAGARIGMVRFAITTASSTVESESDGSLRSVPITLPQNASGTYNIAALSATSVGGTAAATIAAEDGALPVTGLAGGAMLGILVGGGALVAAGIALGVAAVLRRRAHAD